MHGAIGNTQLKSLCLEMDERYTWRAGAGRQDGETGWGAPFASERDQWPWDDSVIIPMA